MMSSHSKQVFAMIFNVPASFHSISMRNFFGELCQQENFTMFHYRHRPMNKNSDSESGAAAAKCEKGDDSKEDQEQIEEKEEASQVSCCCIVKCKLSCYHRLRSAYHLCHWKDEHGTDLPTQCHIYPVICVKENPSQSIDDIADDYSISSTDTNREKGKLYMPYKDILEFKEMNPPDLMPKGNIGTPESYFLKLINACRLPPIIVKKLGLKFKKKGGKYYSSVPFDYPKSARVTLDSASSSTSKHFAETPQLSGPAHTALRQKILDHEGYIQERLHIGRLERDRDRARRDLRTEKEKTKAADRRLQKEQNESDGETEEWDRHEAFHDDPTNIERNKERLFEEKIELKWEKGGSGLVFYTDAQYWKQLEGDFDEQTADDWDVDMSEYYEPGTGDKDARDFIKMRKEKRVRDDIAHLEELSSFDKPIGAFEKHTRGKGRELLQNQGWHEGQGVGKDNKGRAHIIDTGGQHPRDKRGFGFYGEKIARFIPPGSRKRRSDEPIISTIYDDPAQTDEPDQLLERKNPHNIKHRPSTNSSESKHLKS